MLIKGWTMADSMHLFWLLFLHLPACFDALLTPQQINHTVSLLREFISAHHGLLDTPMVKDELFCRCNVAGCDSELYEIGGKPMRGICRAVGGQCRQMVHVSLESKVEKVQLDCLPPDLLHPPDQPFLCQSSAAKVTRDYAICCSEQFCNDIDVPRNARNEVEEQSDFTTSWPVHVALIIGIALTFLAVGLVLGAWWLSSGTSRRAVRDFVRRHASRNSIMYTLANVSLNGLLDADGDNAEQTLEQSESLSDGTSYLVKRTIARQISLQAPIARGRFGEVWIGDWRGEKVAVKIFNTRDEQSWSRETEIYSSNMLRHSNLLRWIASDNKDTGTITQLWLITEYLPHGCLYDYLALNTLSLTEAVQFVRSIAHGLTYLHTEVPGISGVNSQCYKCGIAHRDIKTKNILVRNDKTCAIADLGMAARYSQGQLNVPNEGRGGTVRYLAPEFLNDTLLKTRFMAYTQLDIYALGLCIWEVMRRVRVDETTEPPRSEVPYFEYVEREPCIEEMREIVCVQKKRPQTLKEWDKLKVARHLSQIMCECWAESPAARLTALNIRCTIDKLVEEEKMQIMT